MYRQTWKNLTLLDRYGCEITVVKGRSPGLSTMRRACLSPAFAAPYGVPPLTGLRRTALSTAVLIAILQLGKK